MYSCKMRRRSRTPFDDGDDDVVPVQYYSAVLQYSRVYQLRLHCPITKLNFL